MRGRVFYIIIFVFVYLSFTNCNIATIIGIEYPDSPQYYTEKGISLYQNGEYEEALNYFNKAIETDSTIYEARKGRASCIFAIHFNLDTIYTIYNTWNDNERIIISPELIGMTPEEMTDILDTIIHDTDYLVNFSDNYRETLIDAGIVHILKGVANLYKTGITLEYSTETSTFDVNGLEEIDIDDPILIESLKDLESGLSYIEIYLNYHSSSLYRQISEDIRNITSILELYIYMTGG